MTGTQVALKRIKKYFSHYIAQYYFRFTNLDENALVQKYALREVKAIKKLRSRNVVGLSSYFQHDNFNYIAIEFCETVNTTATSMTMY